MSNKMVRFHSFILKQKPSVQKMSISRLLDRLDKTHFSIYVKDEKSLKNHLSAVIFERSLEGNKALK